MLAFIRGASTSSGPGQIYVKLLPDGEPVQLTHDDLSQDRAPVLAGRSAHRVPRYAQDGNDVGHLGRARTRRAAAPFLDQREGLTWIADRAGKPASCFPK